MGNKFEELGAFLYFDIQSTSQLFFNHTASLVPYSQIAENLPFLISHKMNFLYQKYTYTNIVYIN